RNRLIAARDLAHCLTVASFNVGRKTTDRQKWSHWDCLKPGQLFFHQRVDNAGTIHVSALGGFAQLPVTQQNVVTAAIEAAVPGAAPPALGSAAEIARRASKAERRRISKQTRSDVVSLHACLAKAHRILGKKNFVSDSIQLI
ncbi:hypothetical protein POSPLADRAFT_1137561, partial [Postia placenta MAD-698-R-SB12]